MVSIVIMASSDKLWSRKVVKTKTSAVKGEKGFVQYGYFADKGKGGFFRCGLRAFWSKKLRIFRNFWSVRMDKGGWASADILWTRGEGGGSIFRDFEQMSFMDGL